MTRDSLLLSICGPTFEARGTRIRQAANLPPGKPVRRKNVRRIQCSVMYFPSSVYPDVAATGSRCVSRGLTTATLCGLVCEKLIFLLNLRNNT